MMKTKDLVQVYPKHKNCFILQHPVLRHKLTYLRRKESSSEIFRRVLTEVSSLMAFEVTHDLKTRDVSINTPFEKTPSPFVDEHVVAVAIQRAGSGMLDGVLSALPFARVGHIGIYRDKFTRNTVEYYFRLPEQPKGSRVLLLDPLVATGDTALAALDRLKEYEVGRIQFLSVLASPTAIAKLKQFHPDVEIYCLSVEREVDKNGYLLPGIGDAGDRLYNTELELP